MDTGMSTKLYPLPDGDGDGTKVWYPLDLSMGMGIKVFYGYGYGIAKLVPSRPVAIPRLAYLLSLFWAPFETVLFVIPCSIEFWAPFVNSSPPVLLPNCFTV